MDGNDPGMFEAREDPRLALEPVGEFAAVDMFCKNLHGHVAVELPVVRPPDHAHPAATDDFAQGIPRREFRLREAVTQPLHCPVGKLAHGASMPSRSRTSSRYSASLPAS